MSKSLPISTHTFSVDLEGEVSRTKYQGSFTCKILTRGERALVEKHRAFLNGDLISQLDIGTLNFNYMIAFLKYSLTDSPKFWKDGDYGFHLLDENIIIEVYKKTIEFEEKWLKEIWGDEVGKFTKDEKAD